MTEFDCPEVTLCAGQDVKIQLPTNFCCPKEAEVTQEYQILVAVLLQLCM